jgi:hypothetical protein
MESFSTGKIERTSILPAQFRRIEASNPVLIEAAARELQCVITVIDKTIRKSELQH